MMTEAPERTTTAARADLRLPVTLLTGFLGSGKTTLLNRWLQDPRMADAAVIVNELGEIGIDHALIAHSTERTIELSNGCLCCSMGGDLVDTLRDLYVQRERGEVRPFARVVIETTGLADPAPMIQVLMAQPVTTRFRLASTVTTFDALSGEAVFERHVESVRQLAVADRIVVTKADMVSPPRLLVLESRLRELAPSAELLRSTPTQPASVELLLADGEYRPRMNAAEALRWLRSEVFTDRAGTMAVLSGPPDAAAARTAASDADAASGAGAYRRYAATVAGDAARGAHTAGIASFAFRFDEPFAWIDLAAWLDALVIAHAEKILRIKGIVAIESRERPIVVHAVQGMFNPPTALDAWPDADRASRVVFIVQGLTRDYIESVLTTIRSKPAA